MTVTDSPKLIDGFIETYKKAIQELIDQYEAGSSVEWADEVVKKGRHQEIVNYSMSLLVVNAMKQTKLLAEIKHLLLPPPKVVYIDIRKTHR